MSAVDLGREQIRQTHAMQHLTPNAVHDREGDVGAVLRRIDMYPEGPFAERHIHDLDDRIGHRRRVCVGRRDGGKGLLYARRSFQSGGHDNCADHRGVNRAVVAPITGPDCYRLAQRARRERAGVDGAVIEHEMMGHIIQITPHN